MPSTSLSGSPGSSQSWNRYAYVLGNPQRYRDPFGLQPKASFDDHICVTASGGPCGGPNTATQLAAARLQFNQQQRAANGAISGPHGGGLVVAPPGGEFCSDFTCRVMADVGRNANASRALEIGVTEFSVFMVTGPLFFPRLGAPPVVFQATLTVRTNLHHTVPREILRLLPEKVAPCPAGQPATREQLLEGSRSSARAATSSAPPPLGGSPGQLAWFGLPWVRSGLRGGLTNGLDEVHRSACEAPRSGAWR